MIDKGGIVLSYNFYLHTISSSDVKDILLSMFVGHFLWVDA